METNIKIKEVSELEQINEIDEQLARLKKKLLKLSATEIDESDSKARAKLDKAIDEAEKKFKELKSQSENTFYPKWILVEENDDKENVLIDFSAVLDENVYDVEGIDNDFFELHYSDWTGGEVMAIVNGKGNLVVKNITDYTPAGKSAFIIYATGLKYDENEDDNYASVIDILGNEIIAPEKNVSIEFLENNNLYQVNKKYLYNNGGGFIGINETANHYEEEDFIIFTINEKQGLLLKDTVVIEPKYDYIREEYDAPSIQVFYINADGKLGAVIYYEGDQVFFIEPQFETLFQSTIPYIFIASTIADTKLVLTCDVKAKTFDCFAFTDIVEINMAVNSDEYICCGINAGQSTLFYPASLLSFDFSDFSIIQQPLYTDNIKQIRTAIAGLLETRFDIINRY